MTENLAETVARLQATRDAAITETVVDGITAKIDQGVANQQLRAARRRQAIEDGLADPRPIASAVKLT